MQIVQCLGECNEDEVLSPSRRDFSISKFSFTRFSDGRSNVFSIFSESSPLPSSISVRSVTVIEEGPISRGSIISLSPPFFSTFFITTFSKMKVFLSSAIVFPEEGISMLAGSLAQRRNR